MNRKSALLFFCLLAFSVLPALAWANPRTVRIGIQSGASTGTIESTEPMRCVDGKGRSLAACSRALLEYSSGRLLVNGQAADFPVEFQGPAVLRWNGRPYRGNLRLVTDGTGFSAVNVVDVESYLRGVLKIEVNPAWPMEALKAQAVIARTYALRQTGRHGRNGFDLCATTHCQAYRGMSAEDPKTDRAIEETRGIVVSYGSQLAQTFYFADGAGWTADVSTVWGGGVPYLNCRPEPVSYETPHSRWNAILSQEAMQKTMKTLKAPVGTVLEVRPSEKDRGNRVTQLEIRGTERTVTVKGHAFRMAAGSNVIRSTLFEIVPAHGQVPASLPPIPATAPSPLQAQPSGHGEDPLVTLTRQGAFSSAELMDMLLHPEKREEYIRKAGGKPAPANPPRPFPLPPAPGVSRTGNAPSFFEVNGKGWGHGVGLSQWGAKALSEKGWDYRSILSHYYPGTSLSSMP